MEYIREYNDGDPVNKQWNTSQAKTLFKLVTNGSALEWGCEIPEFSAMGAPGGGSVLTLLGVSGKKRRESEAE